MGGEYNRVYKVRIRKQFHMTEKAEVALKSGRIETPAYSAICGTYLEPGKLYVIMGKVRSLKAVVNMCNFVAPWKELTKRQRKGLNRMYRNGCTCKICFGWSCKKSPDTCHWTTIATRMDCQSNEVSM